MLASTSFDETVSYLMETYVKIDFKEEIEAGILHFKQLSNMMETECAKALWNKALRCDRGHGAYFRKIIFITGLHRSIWHIMR